MDLIDRQAAIDMIRLYREDEAVDLDELESSIAMMPSVQPEIIRCKDCKHSSPDGVYGCRLEGFRYWDTGDRMYADDWCSRAERRTDEAD